MVKLNRSPKIMRKQQQQAGFGIVEAVVVLIVLALVGIGGWYVWSANQKSPTSNNNNNTTTQSKTYSTFAITPAPFSFQYVSDWSYVVDTPLQADTPISDQFSITLAAPGTTVEETLIGGGEVTRGARVVVWSTKTALTDVHGRFTGVYSNATNKTDTTVAGVTAVEYEFTYEGQPGIFTDFIKGGRLYSVGYYAPGNERSSNNFVDYKDLLASFKFL